eukprot:EG_transcript_8581
MNSSEDAIASLDELIGNELSQFKGRNGWGASRVKPVFGALGEGWAIAAAEQSRHRFLSTGSRGPEPLDPTHLSSLSSSVGASSNSTACPSPSSASRPPVASPSPAPDPSAVSAAAGPRRIDVQIGPKAAAVLTVLDSAEPVATATGLDVPGRKERRRRASQEPPRAARATPATIHPATLPAPCCLMSCGSETPAPSLPKQRETRVPSNATPALLEGESPRLRPATSALLPPPSASLSLALGFEVADGPRAGPGPGPGPADWGAATLELLALATRIVASERGAAFSAGTRQQIASSLRTLQDALDNPPATGGPLFDEGVVAQPHGCLKVVNGATASPRHSVTYAPLPSPRRWSAPKTPEAGPDSPPPTKVVRHRTLRPRSAPSTSPRASGQCRSPGLPPVAGTEEPATTSPSTVPSRGRPPSFALQEEDEEGLLLDS